MEERKVPGKNELRKREPVIQVKNLYKVYRVGETKVYALNGVDFTMYRGEFCAIVGTSGSGKSTLLNMLAGLEKPTKGDLGGAGRHLCALYSPDLSGLLHAVHADCDPDAGIILQADRVWSGN